MSSYTYVGISTAESWEAAGKEAATRALSFFNGSSPKLMIVMCTEDADYPEVYRGVRAVCQTPVMGANTKYLYTQEGFFYQGAVAVVVCLWDGELVGPIAYHRDSDVLKVRSEFADKLLGYRDRYDVSIYTLWSGFNYVQNVADDWYNTLGPEVHIFGGGCREVYLEDKIYSDDGVAVAFVSRDKFGYVLGHGSKPVGRPVVITRSEGNIIYEIDGIRATDVYDRIVEDIIKKYEKEASEIDLYFAFGYPTIDGEYVLQEPVLIDREKGTVVMFLDIPNNSVVRILVGRRASHFSHSREMVKEYVQMFKSKPTFNFIINCVGRMDSLIKLGVEKELEVFRQHLVPHSFFAFSSIGELGIPKGMPVYNHQKTLIIFGAV